MSSRERLWKKKRKYERKSCGSCHSDGFGPNCRLKYLLRFGEVRRELTKFDALVISLGHSETQHILVK